MLQRYFWEPSAGSVADSRVQDVVSRVQAVKHLDLATTIGLNDPTLPCIRNFDVRFPQFYTNRPEVMFLDKSWAMRDVSSAETRRCSSLHTLDGRPSRIEGNCGSVYGER
jgi:hypothetical protein